MATFLTDLWTSIFTPGPTPTLLVATNVSFAALQVLFLSLLLATYSVHFVILSGLTAGLWWAINWFAREIRAAQEKEEEAKKIRDARKGREKEKDKVGSEGEAMDTGDDTEVDTEVEEKYRVRPEYDAAPVGIPGAFGSSSIIQAPQSMSQGQRESTPVQLPPSTVALSTTGASTKLEPQGGDSIKKRSMGESTGELSTDSEWEKVSEASDR